MSKLTIRDIDVAGQEVLMRADFNVPTNDDFEITDETRIQAALPTIKQLISSGARLVLCSHMGRPTEARENKYSCLLYTSPSPRDRSLSRMPSSA